VRSGTTPSPAAEAICTAVDCFPLGIELAAGLTRTLTVDQIAARIDDRLRLLIGGRRAGGNRHTSLLAALDWSHELLDQPARTVFRRLAVFADGCTLEAAEKVVAGNGLDEVELVALLDELVDRCLLTVANGRFHQLESIHAYAWRQLELAGDEEPVRRRHLAWSVEQVTGLDQYGGSEHARTVRRFDQEMANLRAAVRWALGPGSDPAAAIAIAAPSRWHWWNHRLTDETLDWLRRALAALAPDAIRSRAEGTLALAFMTHNKSELGATADHLHQALADFEELADETGAIWALIGLGWSALALDDPAAAIEYGRQSSGRSLQAGDPDGQAAGLNTIGLALRSLDRYEEAVGYFTEALDCWRSTGAQHSAAVALSNLAIVARRLGRYAESRRLCLESLQQFQHFELVDNQLDIVDCWAQLEAAEGRPAEALRLLTVAVRQRELRAAPVFVSDELANRDTSLAAVRSTLGDGAAAIEAAALRIPLGVVVEEILGSG
jgi:tetratricopeptide (TPR) repeat protein